MHIYNVALMYVYIRQMAIAK